MVVRLDYCFLDRIFGELQYLEYITVNRLLYRFPFSGPLGFHFSKIMNEDCTYIDILSFVTIYMRYNYFFLSFCKFHSIFNFL